ncbi:MAG: hypothetical protein QHC67_12435 [Sphingobium sp.]|uniref:hypothetical protein n=1 Tax=Sphingobium sp. TaxID=1912891 RepID=UPI0029B159FB|nr:hypothetical protein [Sphingobium sp.]MDX3910609.1 hypothetical protein [Sphingobium sp.]
MRRHLGVGAVIGLFLLGSAPLLAQGIGHSFFMRGKIVRMDAGCTVACLGKANGAQVGQILEVYHATPRHRRMVGHVQVDQIFDDHFAHFQVSDGTP